MTESRPPASDGHHCDQCGRILVTDEALAMALHSGCALTGERHDFADCPDKASFLRNARSIRRTIERQSGP